VVELHPLDLPDLPDLPRPGPVDAGWARSFRQPRTVAEILAGASAAMDAEDAELERQRDPVAWARAHRPRRLIDRLLGRY